MGFEFSNIESNNIDNTESTNNILADISMQYLIDNIPNNQEFMDSIFEHIRCRCNKIYKQYPGSARIYPVSRNTYYPYSPNTYSLENMHGVMQIQTLPMPAILKFLYTLSWNNISQTNTFPDFSILNYASDFSLTIAIENITIYVKNTAGKILKKKIMDIEAVSKHYGPLLEHSHFKPLTGISWQPPLHIKYEF